MTNKYPIAIAAGGTGGHLFPALSLAKALKEKGHPLLFLGGNLSKNRLFNSEDIPYRQVACSRISLKSPLFPFSIAQGALETLSAFKQFKPSLLIGFGSYYTFPVLLAAKFSKVPYMLHEQNSVPGRVNRFFSKGTVFTAVHFPDSARLLKGKTVEVEMPLRSDFTEVLSKEEARLFYGFCSDSPILLVFGGSQGARAINQLMFDAAPQMQGWQVLHFTGNSLWTNKLSLAYAASGVKACVKDFEPKMAKAWQVADLAISRAGAASIAEQIAFSVPGILIPYPYATDQHQEHNANFMVDIVRGAVKFEEKAFSPARLIEALRGLKPCLKEMQEAILYYKKSRKPPSFIEKITQFLE